MRKGGLVIQDETSPVNFLLSPEIFRAYDIRGVVGETLTPAIVRLIGQAIATLAQAAGNHTVIVGRDGRLSGPTLCHALIEGILATGCDVIDIGMVPTPLLYFATHHLTIPSGVMLTGSHNPANYNGLKIVINGETLRQESIQQLYQMILENNFKKGKGNVTEYNIISDYFKAILHDMTVSRPLKIVVDCGNGVAGSVAPQLYQALNCEVIPLFCMVDGNFPNHHPDPSQPKNLQDLIQAVQSHQADFGLAFDGDGDRLGVVDNTGKIIWPDRQLILFAEDVLSRHPEATILFDVKCTRHVESAIKKLGGNPLMWKTGHSLIKAKMKETGALLAGEMSGHLFFKERWFGFDDALYAGARLLEIFSNDKKQRTVAEHFAALPDSFNTPELQIAVLEETKFKTVQELIAAASFEDARISTIDGLRVDFSDGFGLVRPSNTTASLVLRFEGDSQEALKRIQDHFRTLFLNVMPLLAEMLPF